MAIRQPDPMPVHKMGGIVRMYFEEFDEWTARESQRTKIGGVSVKADIQTIVELAVDAALAEVRRHGSPEELINRARVEGLRTLTDGSIHDTHRPRL